MNCTKQVNKREILCKHLFNEQHMSEAEILSYRKSSNIFKVHALWNNIEKKLYRDDFSIFI